MFRSLENQMTLVANNCFYGVSGNINWYEKLINKDIIPTRDEVIYKTSFSRPVANLLYRSDYIENFSFPLITKDVIREFSYMFHNSRILEIGCGTGYFIKSIREFDQTIKMIPTDDFSWDEEHWVRKHINDIICLSGIDAIELYHDKIDYVLLSWPPYLKPLAFDILERCIKYSIPMIYIGENEGGCCGDDLFFDLIENKCFMEQIIHSYISFDCIHDRFYLIKKR